MTIFMAFNVKSQAGLMYEDGYEMIGSKLINQWI